MLFLTASSIAAVGLTACLYMTARKIIRPPEWDFLCFWVYGRALALGESPYDVQVLLQLAAPYAPSEEFVNELYCLYPPPSTLQFLPLGWLPIQAAAAAWYLVQWAALMSVVALVWRLLDPKRSWTGFMITVALVCGLHSTISTLRFAQSNFLIVLAGLLATMSSSWATRGMALGAATLVKPLGAILALDLFLKRDWKALDDGPPTSGCLRAISRPPRLAGPDGVSRTKPAGRGNCR
jgi:hypothetical protein